MLPGQFLIQLLRNELSPRHELRAGSLLRAINCFVRAMRNPHLTREWLDFLETFARAHDLPPARPEIVMKPLGNFAIHGLNVHERVALLRSHYALSAKAIPRRLLSSLWGDASVDLGDLCGKSGKTYRLTLDPARHCFKEGEYSLTLTDAMDGVVLAKLTFVLTHLSGKTPERVALIGGLQGPSTCFDMDRKGRIVSATRDLSGLRPKMAVFVALSAFAAASGATSLRAVSNRTHTINADASYQRKRLRADYDAFWIERRGVPDAFGFKLPLDLAPKLERTARNEQRAQVVTLVESQFQTKVSPL